LILRKTRVNRFDKQQQRTGIWVKTDSLFRIFKSVQYLDDLKNGFLKEYDASGNLTKLEKYVNDILQAEEDELNKVKLQKSFYQDGIVKSQGAYLKGKPVGLHTFYDSTGNPDKARIYENGYLTAEGLLDEQGRRQGEWKEFYLDGSIKSQGNYLDDLKNGNWEYLFFGGAMEQKGSYSNGLPTGRWNWYYETGELLREEVYQKGKEEGFAFELEPNGDTLSTGEYYRGQKEGRWLFKDGDQRIIGNFAAGEMNGKWVHFFDNGQKSFEGDFRESLAEGSHKAWYPEGEIKWTGSYSSGIRQGVWTKFLPDGTMELSITYEDGVEKKYNGIKIFPEFSPADFESLIQKNPYIY
ncbi:MAG: hypothetical protein WED33_07050, partial [Bacteroidia bacterium]